MSGLAHGFAARGLESDGLAGARRRQPGSRRELVSRPQPRRPGRLSRMDGLGQCGAIRFETQLVGLGYGLTGPSAPRMATWSLQGPIHGAPRQPAPEPSPATELHGNRPMRCVPTRRATDAWPGYGCTAALRGPRRWLQGQGRTPRPGTTSRTLGHRIQKRQRCAAAPNPEPRGAGEGLMNQPCAEPALVLSSSGSRQTSMIEPGRLSG